MAYAIVGSLGAVSTGASGAGVTPAYGQTPTRGNQLVCWVAACGTATGFGTNPTGWSLVEQGAGSTTVRSGMYYKIAVGSDAQPTVAGIASSVLNCQLGEFSGNALVATADAKGTGSTTATSPVTSTNGAADIASGELLIIACALHYTSAATATLTLTSNHVTSVTATTSAANNTAAHYAFGYGATNSASGADTGVLAFTTTNASGVVVSTASFQLARTSNGMLEVL